jgi:O-antigen/teichoic acid export membrane protein
MSVPESTNNSANEHEALVSQAAKSFKWSMLYNAAPRLVTPFSTMILAALLTPADFGLVAISTLVIALANILVDLGFGKAVVQNKENVDEFASISMWFSLVMSIGIYSLIWVASPWVSELYHNLKVINVVRVSALSLPLTALTVIPKALLRRNMQFNRLFWANSSYLVIQAIASVILALVGLGAWSMIWGQLIGLFISSVIVWATVTWRPKLVWNWSIAKIQLKFSLWIMFSSFQAWLFQYADNAIAGMLLGVSAMGVYTLGFNIAIIIPSFIVAALNDVAYPAFCKLQGDVTEVGKSLVNLQRITGAILFPIVFGISAIASPTVKLLYGDKWQGLGTVISLLVIMPGLGYLWSVNESAYISVGKPAIYTKLSAVSLLLLLPLLWVTAPHGLYIFTIARFAGALLLPLGNMIIGARSLGLNFTKQIKPLALPFLAALAMFILIFFAASLLQPFKGISGWLKLFLLMVSGAIIYALSIRVLGRGLWDDLLGGMRRVFAKR